MSRPDWHDFYDLETLPRKGGGSLQCLARTVVKEVVDNALDVSGACRFGLLPNNGFYVENDKDFDSNPETVAHLFSVNRPQRSTKMYRQPQRGAMGNGLRVVAGAVYATGGRLAVRTGGRCIELTPQDDGSTTFATLAGAPAAGVTRIEVTLGPRIKVGDDALAWGRLADEIARAPGGEPSKEPSVHWHSPGTFFGLFRYADPATTVRQVIECFSGCKADKLRSEVCRGLPKFAAELSKADARSLLAALRERTRVPKHSLLGRVGNLPGWENTALVDTQITVSGITLPVRAEAWARPAKSHTVTLCLNRTPCPANVHLISRQYGKARQPRLALTGAGLADYLKTIDKRAVELVIHVMCPAMPITENTKVPDLRLIAPAVYEAAGCAADRVISRTSVAISSAVELAKPTVKQLIVDCWPEAAAEVSGGGQLSFSLRRLFYRYRPRFKKVFGDEAEPIYDTFAKVIGGIEDEEGDIKGMYRDNRGTLYTPHTETSMPLGTLTVQNYKRPELIFNKVLYVEKEGLFPLLTDAKWPHRHDCALATGKGFGTRAAGDVFATMLDASDEPLAVYCIHDCDGPGTEIYESLQEMADKRTGGRVKIINLGLDPDEAQAMGLEKEGVTAKGSSASYLSDHEREWLKTARVELDVMTSPQTIEWLDKKMAERLEGKVIPTLQAVQARLATATEKAVRERRMREVLEAVGFEGLVAADMARLTPAVEGTAERLGAELPTTLSRPRPEHWSRFVETAGEELVRSAENWPPIGPFAAG